MRLSILLLISTFLGACSGDSMPVFTDVNAAIDQADSAKSAGDTDLAKAGYEYARDNGDGDSQADALMGLFELGCAGADDEMAFANFDALSSSHTGKLTPGELKRMVDLCVTSATVETGDAIIGFAMEAFPEMQADLTMPAAAIEKIRTEGPGADLSGLGYAGDWLLSIEQQAVERIAQTLRDKPAANLMLATGSTMEPVYALLREASLDFSLANTFNLDEYLDGNQFREFMNAQLFEHVNICAENVHFPAIDYDELIAEAGGIDLCILGIGVNGHIAFNEPGSSVDSRTRIVELDVSTRVRNSQLSGAEIPSKAISVGIATILDCKQIIVVASGEEKHEAVNNARYSDISDKCPASFLQTHSDVTWLVS